MDILAHIQIYPTDNQVKLEERELYERQMSKEAIRYQNDWKDLIWLVGAIQPIIHPEFPSSLDQDHIMGAIHLILPPLFPSYLDQNK